MSVLRLMNGDCVARMAQLPEASVDAIVCDPPYGLEFMGKAWDKLDWQAGGGFSKPGIGARQTAWPSYSATAMHGAANPTCAVCGGRLRGAKKCSCPKPHDHWKPIGKRRNPENEGLPDTMTSGGMARHLNAIGAWHQAWLREAYRVLDPGGVIKAFGGSRTYHRLAAAMETVGFVDVGIEAWGYGSGFPKSLDVSKAIDKHWGRYKAGDDGEYLQQEAATRVTALKQELRRLYDLSGKSRSQIDAECGFRASNYLSTQEPGKRPDPWFYVLPSQEKWETIKRVLGLEATLGFDEARKEQAAIHQRLNDLFKGAERAVVGFRKVHRGVAFSAEGPDEVPITAPATPEAEAWDGWGTALKPSWEPVVVGRKPVGCPLPPGELP